MLPYGHIKANFGEHMWDINIWAVLVATLFSMVFGALWYWAFSKPWMTALGINLNDIEDAQLSMGKAYMASTFASVVVALSIAVFASWMNADTLFAGVLIGVVGWAGFNFSSMFKLIFWEDRPWPLFWIDGGYDLICFAVVGGIIGAWR